MRMMRMRVSRIREVTAQRLRREFEHIAFKEGKTLDAFGLHITTLVNNLRSLGDMVEEVKLFRKPSEKFRASTTRSCAPSRHCSI